MPKFIIKWNAGYGQSEEVVEHGSHEDATEEAYQRWKEDAESYAEYSAEIATADGLEELGLDPEEFGLEATP